MTCIAAIKHEGKVYIGADSAAGKGTYLTLRADEKVFKNGKFGFGFTSSFRMGQLLRYRLSPPEQKGSQGDVEFMNTSFIDAVRKCLKSGGYAKVDNNVEKGGVFIVGYKGQIYKIESDFQVAIPLANYDSCGCGEDIALGALHVLDKQKKRPREKILAALKAAQAFSSAVREPFKIISV